MNPYEALGIKSDASDTDVVKAYRKLARKYHPDVSVEPDAEAKFKEIKAAYEILKDPERRAHFDATGDDDVDAINPPMDMLRVLMKQVLIFVVNSNVQGIINIRGTLDQALDETQDKINSRIAECKEQVAGLKKCRRLLIKKSRKGRNIYNDVIDAEMAMLTEFAEVRLPAMLKHVAAARLILKDYERGNESLDPRLTLEHLLESL